MSGITFIGGGNMATAIIGGLVGNGRDPADITVSDPSAEQRDRLAAEHGVKVTDDALAACDSADIIVLAVKPQVIAAVAAQIPGKVDMSGRMLLSIVAGITLERLELLFGEMAMARTMPNTPALCGLGATGLYLNAHVSEAQAAEATAIIEAFGICVPVAEESLLDAVTAVSGSGPAYFFLLIEEMIKAGVRLGLSEEEATRLATQTALGAGTMAARGDVPPAELRRRVTSPNGTTHAAIVSMEESGFGDVIDQAMTACRDRAVELGKV